MGCKAIAPGLIVVVVASAVSAHADVFNMGGTQRRYLDGPCKPAVRDRGRPRQRGRPRTRNRLRVGSHIYQMGKYDVTIGQYVAFLNSVATQSDPYGLYNSDMADSVSDDRHYAKQQSGHLQLLGHGHGHRRGELPDFRCHLGRCGPLLQLAG